MESRAQRCLTEQGARAQEMTRQARRLGKRTQRGGDTMGGGREWHKIIMISVNQQSRRAAEKRSAMNGRDEGRFLHLVTGVRRGGEKELFPSLYLYAMKLFHS